MNPAQTGTLISASSLLILGQRAGEKQAEKPLRRPVARTVAEISSWRVLVMTEEVHMQAIGFPFMQSQVSVQVQCKFI